MLCGCGNAAVFDIRIADYRERRSGTERLTTL